MASTSFKLWPVNVAVCGTVAVRKFAPRRPEPVGGPRAPQRVGEITGPIRSVTSSRVFSGAPAGITMRLPVQCRSASRRQASFGPLTSVDMAVACQPAEAAAQLASFSIGDHVDLAPNHCLARSERKSLAHDMDRVGGAVGATAA